MVPRLGVSTHPAIVTRTVVQPSDCPGVEQETLLWAMTDEARAGLCATCAHVRRVPSSRGSVFYLCEQSMRDPSFRQYPVIPVRICSGYAQAPSKPTTECR